MGDEEPLFPLDFDEEALVEDLARVSDGGSEALDGLRAEVQRMGGLPHSRLKACEAEGADGTNLDGCVKTYVPGPTGTSAV